MARFTIPRADSVSPVRIRSLHWHKYIGDIIKDYILTGLGLSAGTGLNVNVATGRGYVRGIDFESDAIESVAVVASSTNSIFAQLTFDGELGITGWQFVVNQTGTPPADSILLGTATTDGAGVTGTDTTGTQQGLALEDFAVGTIKALQGNTNITFADDVSIGAKKLKTTGFEIFDTATNDVITIKRNSGNNTSNLHVQPSGTSTSAEISVSDVSGDVGITNNNRLSLLIDGVAAYLKVARNTAGGTILPLTIRTLQTSGVTVDWITFTHTTQIMNFHGRDISNHGKTTFKDIDGTPVADRQMTIVDGLFRARDTSNVEGRYLSRASLEQIKDAEIASDAAIAPSKLALKEKWVIKSSDETITNDSTLSDDDALVIALEANKTYIGMAVIYFESDATPDFKYAFIVPTGASGERPSSTMTVDGNVSQSLTSVNTISVSGVFIVVVCIPFRIITGSSAGNLAFQWAQNTADAANTSVKKGSSLMVREI